MATFAALLQATTVVASVQHQQVACTEHTVAHISAAQSALDFSHTFSIIMPKGDLVVGKARVGDRIQTCLVPLDEGHNLVTKDAARLEMYGIVDDLTNGEASTGRFFFVTAVEHG